MNTDNIVNEEQIMELLRQESGSSNSEWVRFYLDYLLNSADSTPLYSLTIGYTPQILLNADEIERYQQIKKNQAAIQLLDSWTGEDSGYDLRVWQEIKEGLEKNRLSDRSLFNDKKINS